jgi:hypothetical protein
MAIKKTQRGFALLIAVIFMSVMLALGLALGSLGYKQETLASSAVESQYAFYAADAGLECALYADQCDSSNPKLLNCPANLFSNPPAGASLVCGGRNFSISTSSPSSGELISTAWISLDGDSPYAPRCAEVTVYKYSTPQTNNVTTYIFSQGYDVSCPTVQGSGARFVSRGESTTY